MTPHEQSLPLFSFMPLEKVCRRCNLLKPQLEFSLFRSAKDGLNSVCRQCASEQRKERIAKRNNPNPPTHLVCVVCGLSKPVNDFPRNKDTATGFRKECRLCFSEKNRNKYAENPEFHRRKAIKYWEGDVEKIRLQLPPRPVPNPEQRKTYEETRRLRNPYYHIEKTAIIPLTNPIFRRVMVSEG